MNDASRPTLRPKTRLRYDRHRDAFVLLWPERGLLLNRSAGEILERCRGQETLSSIVKALSDEYPQTHRHIIEDHVHRLIHDLCRRGLLTLE
ncbi:MAG TPA: pyrroloquinoline quinone biosynthesis peptide chaperone PqqD [Nitrospira sp.]|nr:pyrroloquinoline quinone biosynthesis peptide chaperone PqqD [Nitrospira sp.]